MKIHVIQREGRRHFSRFTDIAERDRLQVELQIEDKNGQTILIDLTEALIGEYSKHPELGRISTPSAVVEITSLQPIKPLTAKRSKTVAPAYLADSSTTGILAKVREAQLQAAEEKRQKQAEIAAARAERLVVAREAKAQKSKVKSQKSKVGSPKAAAKPKVESGKPKVAAPKAAKAAPAKPAAKKAVAVKPVKAQKSPPKTKPAPSAKANPAGISKTQAQAIKKIGKVLAKEDKAKRPSRDASKPGTLF